jgi:anti-sigma factor RsiW
VSIPGITISCREIVELMTDYLEARLSDEDRLVFERHIAQCSPCRDYLAQLRMTIKHVGELHTPDEADILPATREALLEAFRGFKRKGS